MQTIQAMGARVGEWLTTRTVSRRTLARLCWVWLALLLLPLIGAALFAYPASDDFACVMEALEAWARTGSLAQTAVAVLRKIGAIYMSWQGTFAATLFFAAQPIIFGTQWYFLSPLFLMALYTLSTLYFVRGVCQRVLHADRDSTTIAFTAVYTLLLAFLPSAREVLFWHTGGSYTISFAFALLLGGLLIRLNESASRPRTVWRWLAAMVCAISLGGGMYPLALAGTVAMGVYASFALITRARNRRACLASFLVCGVSLLVMVIAPGNAVRSSLVGPSMSPVRAVLQSLLDALEVGGDWCGPEVVGCLAVALLALLPALRNSRLRFAHPALWTVLLYGVFAAAIVPSTYAMGENGYQVERVLSTLHNWFVVIAFVTALYWLGWGVRFAERRRAASALAPGAASPAPNGDKLTHSHPLASSPAILQAAEPIAPAAQLAEGAKSPEGRGNEQPLASSPAILQSTESIAPVDPLAEGAKTPEGRGNEQPLASSPAILQPTEPIAPADQLAEGAKTPEGREGRDGWKAWVLALALVLTVWGGFADAIMARPSIAAVKMLLTGEAARYHAEQAAREPLLETVQTRADAAACSIAPLTSQPILYREDLLSYDFQAANRLVQGKYQRLQTLIAQYGPGRIPADQIDHALAE